MLLGQQESKDGQEELHGRVPSPAVELFESTPGATRKGIAADLGGGPGCLEGVG